MHAIIERLDFSLAQMTCCSVIGGKGIIVSAIAEPEISLKVVPVARCSISFVRAFRQKYKYSLIDIL